MLLDVAENNYCVLSNFPKEFFVNFEDYLSIYNQIQIFEKSPNLIEQTINLEVIGSKKASLDEIFAIFLIKIAKHLKIPYFKEIALFICIYKKALIEISKLEKETNEKNKLEDSSTELNAEFIIEKSNEFILDLLPKLLPLYKFENLVFLGEDVDQINNAILLTQHFGNWLYSSHFTDSKLEINYSNLNK